MKIHPNRRNIINPDSPATAPQIRYLTGLKVEYTAEITKLEAAQLIDQTVKAQSPRH